MSEFSAFVHDVYDSGRKKFVKGLALTAANGLTSGFGVLLIVPLLSLAGLTETSGGILGGLSSIFGNLSPAIRLPLVLLAYTCILVVQALIDRASSIVEIEVACDFSARQRERFFEALVSANWEYLAGKSKADTGNFISLEASRFGSGAAWILSLASLIVVAGIQIIVAAFLSPLTVLFVALMGMGYLLFTQSASTKAKQAGKTILERNRELHREVLSRSEGIKELKVYGVERESVQAFRDICDRLRDSAVDFTVISSSSTFLSKIGATVLVSIFLYLSVKVAAISVTALLVVIYTFARVWPLFSSFRHGLQQLGAILPSYLAFEEEVDRLESAADVVPTEGRADEIPPLDFSDSLRLENVAYSYPGRTEFALCGIDLEIKAGSIVLLTGKSGAGKSTLADIVAGLIQPTMGEVKVDGRKLEGETLLRWRKSVAYIPQNPLLFSGSVRENIARYNPHADDVSMETSLRRASAEFVFYLRGGLDARIGDNGATLSGGERQRIVLARALLRGSRIMILDEATNSLDEENQKLIRKAILDLRGQLTMLVITHSSSMMSEASIVLSLEEGKLVVGGGGTTGTPVL
ncbi:MAG: ABC transporter ATP-binding protein [Spirochaetes bacterium]|nr:ABC transporter ATP-binding protein [Spirochaetota bacterium]